MDCYFCKRNSNAVDFQGTLLLKRFLSGLGKIRSKTKTGLCSAHQRKVAKSVKRARHLGLLSAVAK